MKTCFVISQTSKANSELKSNADDLFELIIEPALEKFDYKVSRLDQDATNNLITDSVVNWVQTSDLCIIDVTGNNPEVFYQFGRRHEMGRPFILMLQKNQKISFDVKDITVVQYDLSDARKTKDCIGSLRRLIKEFEEYGYQSGNTRASMTDIVSALTRIEKKIDTLNPSKSIDQDSVESAPFS